MFCKWCGNSVQPEDASCASCGKALPPLNACGADVPAEAVLTATPVAVPAAGKKPATMILSILCILLAVAGAVCLLRIQRLENQIQDLENDFDSHLEQCQTTAATAPSVPETTVAVTAEPETEAAETVSETGNETESTSGTEADAETTSVTEVTGETTSETEPPTETTLATVPGETTAAAEADVSR